jgi:hypothetical protein
LVMIEGKAYWLKLDGSVQDDVVREMVIES